MLADYKLTDIRWGKYCESEQGRPRLRGPMGLSEVYRPPLRCAPSKTGPEPTGERAQFRETQHARDFFERTLPVLQKTRDRISANRIKNKTSTIALHLPGGGLWSDDLLRGLSQRAPLNSSPT